MILKEQSVNEYFKYGKGTTYRDHILNLKRARYLTLPFQGARLLQQPLISPSQDESGVPNSGDRDLDSTRPPSYADSVDSIIGSTLRQLSILLTFVYERTSIYPCGVRVFTGLYETFWQKYILFFGCVCGCVVTSHPSRKSCDFFYRFFSLKNANNDACLILGFDGPKLIESQPYAFEKSQHLEWWLMGIAIAGIDNST